MKNETARVVLVGIDSQISFSPLDSDSLYNAIHIEQVIGTLTRMSVSGRYEPYISSSWSVSEDKKTWEFILHDGLRAEDGTPITAATFKKSLEQTISLLSVHTSLPIINSLVGYSAFINKQANTITGISLGRKDEKPSLVFTFEKSAPNGFIEYLALPYLGFYAPGNFNLDGTWKDNSKVISSATYRIIKNDIDEVILERRENWRREESQAHKRVVIQRKPEGFEVLENEKPQIIVQKPGSVFALPQGFSPVPGLRSFLSALIISPTKSAALRNSAFRRELKAAIRSEFLKTEFQSSFDFEPARTIYPHLSSKNSNQDSAKVQLATKTEKPESLTLYLKDSAGLIQKKIEESVALTLKNFGINLTIERLKNVHDDFMKRWKNDSLYDLKVISVDVGGGIETQLLKFMFCSKLGVSFPDPEGRICKLADHYESTYGDLVPEANLKEYAQKLDSIIEEDSYVLPLGHSGLTWLVDKTIDQKSLSPNMNPLYFDRLKLK